MRYCQIGGRKSKIAKEIQFNPSLPACPFFSFLCKEYGRQTLANRRQRQRQLSRDFDSLPHATKREDEIKMQIPHKSWEICINFEQGRLGRERVRKGAAV